jgi:hypothetical protein
VGAKCSQCRQYSSSRGGEWAPSVASVGIVLVVEEVSRRQVQPAQAVF